MNRTLIFVSACALALATFTHAEEAGEELDPVAAVEWTPTAGKSQAALKKAAARAHELIAFLKSGEASPLAADVTKEEYCAFIGLDEDTAGDDLGDKTKWRYIQWGHAKKADSTGGIGHDSRELKDGTGKIIRKDAWGWTNEPKNNPKVGKKYTFIDARCFNRNIYTLGEVKIAVRTLHKRRVLHQGDTVIEEPWVIPGRMIRTQRVVRGPDRYLSTPVFFGGGYQGGFTPQPVNQGFNAPFAPGAVTQVGGNVSITANAGGGGGRYRGIEQPPAQGTPAPGLTPQPMGSPAAGLMPPAGAVIRTIGSGSPLAAPR